MTTAETKSKENINIWVGSETGLLKGIDLTNKRASNHFEESNYGRDFEILRLCWGENNTQLYTCHKNGTIGTFDIETKKFKSSVSIPDFQCGTDSVVDFYKTNDGFATCTACGKCRFWKRVNEETTIQKSYNVGPDVIAMSFNPQEKNLFATGGKENCLKLWDLNSDKDNPVFRAKNLPDDWLQLRVPIWVTGIQFIPDSKAIITCTGKSKIRLYDPSTPKRRPISEMTFEETPITSMTLVPNSNQILVGNTHGSMAMFDWRMKKLLHKYKGFAGSIRSIQCHKTLPYVASCGLDRHLRIHHLETRIMEQKVYLKSRLNCLLVSEDLFSLGNLKNDLEEIKAQKRVHEQSNDEEEEDDLWTKMDKVKETLSLTDTKNKIASNKHVKTAKKKGKNKRNKN